MGIENIRQFVVRNLVFGLLTLLPIVATFYVFFAVVQFFDDLLFGLLPEDSLLVRGKNQIPGAGVVITILIVILTGILTRNYFGKKLITLTNNLMNSIPFAGAIYRTVRQLLEGIFSMDRQKAFRKVVLLEYPRKGVYALAFVAGTLSTPKSKVKEFHTVFLPTSPNPTSGFFLMVPLEELYDIDLKVEDAFRLIVSGGIVGDEIRKRLSSKIEHSLG